MGALAAAITTTQNKHHFALCVSILPIVVGVVGVA
jgi:hypothetical protein